MRAIIVSFVCILAVALMAQAAPSESLSASGSSKSKRSVILAAPVATVVHHNPTTVVKTEQVHSGDGQSSYSYSTEVKQASPVIRTHAAVAAAPAVVPSTYAYSYYPSVASYHVGYPYGAYAYSPYHYVVGK